MGHPRLRNRRLLRTLDLTGRLACLVVIVALAAVLVGCGTSGSGSPAAACQSAHTALPQITPGASRAQLAADAKTANGALSTLTAALGRLPGTSSNPEALANLRNATAIAAASFLDVSSLLVQPGSGILGPITTQAQAAYVQIQQSAVALAAPACTAPSLGGALFTTLAARAGSPAGLNMAFAAHTACQDIITSYGTTQIAVDPHAGITQLARSTAVLRAAVNDLAEVRGAAGAHLRGTLDQAIGILVGATQQITGGANPARTSVGAFIRATAVVNAGFRAARITCSIPGP